MRFLSAVVYLVSSGTCLRFLDRWCPADSLGILRDGLFFVLIFAFFIAATYQFVEGLFDLSDKRRMRMTADRAAWQALFASSKGSQQN